MASKQMSIFFHKLLKSVSFHHLHWNCFWMLILNLTVLIKTMRCCKCSLSNRKQPDDLLSVCLLVFMGCWVLSYVWQSVWKWEKILLKPWVGEALMFWAECVFKLFQHTLFVSLQGGIAFVAIKGAFKVYFKQQQYLRQAHRKILNFPEQEEAWGGRAVRREAGQPDEPHTPLLEGWGEGGRERTVRLWAGGAGETNSGSVSPLTHPLLLHTPHPSHPSRSRHSRRNPTPPPPHFVFILMLLWGEDRKDTLISYTRTLTLFPKNSSCVTVGWMCFYNHVNNTYCKLTVF